jgi:hypothetical protein
MGKKMIPVKAGDVFERLKVLEVLPVVKGHYMVKCLCVCGAEYVCRASGLASGHNKSCGCLHKDILKNGARLKHGKARSRFYKAWAGMIQRCENKNNDRYKDYGGRGITVCEEWHNFESFFNWAMNNGYSEGLQIDRIDNNGPYVPWNCRWVTITENSRNKRTNHFITISGVTKTLTEWAELSGLKLSTLSARVRKGWEETRLLTGGVYAEQIL